MFRKIMDLMDAREKRNASILLFMMLLMGVLEAAGVASIMPFIAVASNREIIHSNHYLSFFYHYLGFENSNSFLILIGSCVFLVVVGGQLFKALTNWLMTHFTYMRSYTLSRRLLSGFLNRPYSWFLNQHSADLGKLILSESDHYVSQVLLPGMKLIANLPVVVFLIALIVYVDPVIALLAAGILGGSFAFIYLVLRRYLNRIGEERLHANRERFRLADEALGGIKALKASGCEQSYIAGFSRSSKTYALRLSMSRIIGQVPRYILEGISIGGMIIIILYQLVMHEEGLADVMPLVALYAFAGYRLMPAMQNIYSSATALRFGKRALSILHKEIAHLQSTTASQTQPKPAQKSMTLAKELRLQNVDFRYPQAERLTLENLDLTISACTTVALVGSTGAGKTTIVDIILGLLVPQQGELIVDGRSIDQQHLPAWRSTIGYVPQSIFLLEESLAGNIAFGVDKQEIDYQRVVEVAKIANLHDFVINELPQGYQTSVGERGVRLSGGQSQRVGIARALYHDPDVLILDEATSALDNLTEKSLMDAIHNLAHKKTIILIAHRLSTVRQCDTIFLLDRGRVVDSGNYDQLMRNSSEFRRLANSDRAYQV